MWLSNFELPAGESRGCVWHLWLISVQEKSRVVFQQQGERNYHIFYQLCAGSSPEQKRRFNLLSAGEYHYLRQSGDTHIPGIDDADEYRATEEAMALLDFSQEEQDAVFTVVCGILHLGNVSFRSTGDRKSEVEDSVPLQTAATLLQLPDADLVSGITTRVMRMRGDSDIVVGLAPAEVLML